MFVLSWSVSLCMKSRLCLNIEQATSFVVLLATVLGRRDWIYCDIYVHICTCKLCKLINLCWSTGCFVKLHFTPRYIYHHAQRVLYCGPLQVGHHPRTTTPVCQLPEHCSIGLHSYHLDLLICTAMYILFLHIYIKIKDLPVDNIIIDITLNSLS